MLQHTRLRNAWFSPRQTLAGRQNEFDKEAHVNYRPCMNRDPAPYWPDGPVTTRKVQCDAARWSTGKKGMDFTKLVKKVGIVKATVFALALSGVVVVAWS